MDCREQQEASASNLGQAKKVNNRRLRAVRLCAFLLAGMILAPSVFSRNADPKEGMKIFWSKGCAHCHPIMGEGAKIGPDLTRVSSVAGGLDFAAAMLTHAPQMWQRMEQERIAIPKFEEGEMEDLFAFLTMAASMDEPSSAETGRPVFQSKRCVECHSIRGKGGKVGPDLASVITDQNPLGWIAAMWNHAPGMFDAMTKAKVPFPSFSENEMADLQAYIREMAGSPNENRPYNLLINPPNPEPKIELHGSSGALPYYLYIHPPNPEQGKILFQVKQCVQCHTVEGYGGSVGPDLSRVALPAKYGAIAVMVWNHAPQMQRMMSKLSIPLPRFEPQEFADLLAYLSSLSMRPQGDSAAGSANFSHKGCSGCHSTVPGGKGVGPNLATLPGDLTPISIASAMWNHGPAMFGQMQRSSVSWPTFSTKELTDTLTYLRSLQAKSPPASTASVVSQ